LSLNCALSDAHLVRRSHHPFTRHSALLSVPPCDMSPSCKSKDNCAKPVQTESSTVFDSVCLNNKKGAERSGTGTYNKNKDAGLYKCSCCSHPLDIPLPQSIILDPAGRRTGSRTTMKAFCKMLVMVSLSAKSVACIWATFLMTGRATREGSATASTLPAFTSQPPIRKPRLTSLCLALQHVIFRVLMFCLCSYLL
jgi:hypothetical protein